MTKLTIVRKLTDAEKELRRMEVRLKQHVSRGRKRPFTELRGLWKETRAISEEDIRKFRLSPDHRVRLACACLTSRRFHRTVLNDA